MNLKNGKFAETNVPKFFDGMPICYDGDEKPKELAILDLALVLVAQAMENTPPVNTILKPNVFFLETPLLEFTPDENMLGCFHQMIVFPLMRWRELELSDGKILMIMVEELCHAVWQVPDGPLIEEKVTEVFRQIYPDFSYHAFFDFL